MDSNPGETEGGHVPLIFEIYLRNRPLTFSHSKVFENEPCPPPI